MTDVSGRIEEYWSWIAVALFLLLTVDTLTTVYAAGVVGTAGESNPLMRWALGRGVGALVAVNLSAVVLTGVLFYGLIRLLRESSGTATVVLALALETWLGLLVATGLAVFANNLSVVVFGRSLV